MFKQLAIGLSTLTTVCILILPVQASDAGKALSGAPQQARATKSTDSAVTLATPSLFVEKLTGMKFVPVKGGCYQMGSPASENGRGSDEGPVHKVCVDDFWMGKYEVTNAQYRRYRPAHVSGNYHGNDLDSATQPVVFVNWNAAINYAKWLSHKTAKTFRLPTEAEWEYAARATTNTVRFWGDDSDQACNFANVGDKTGKALQPDWTVHNCTDGYLVSSPVGTFKGNAFGLYDMLGNVWEWTADRYAKDYYSKSPKNNPPGPNTGLFRVLRGGSWYSGPKYDRVAQRSWYRPDSSNDSLGFRLVLQSDK